MNAADTTVGYHEPNTDTLTAPLKDKPMPATQVALSIVYSCAILLGAFWWLRQVGPGLNFKEPLNQQALGAVGSLGAAMGAVHSLASLGQHAGKGTLTQGWLTFYLTRPFTGAGVAIITMLVLKGGLGGFVVRENVAILAWAALAGLYSQPALDKLKELFATIFKTNDKAAAKAESGRTD